MTFSFSRQFSKVLTVLTRSSRLEMKPDRLTACSSYILASSFQGQSCI